LPDVSLCGLLAGDDELDTPFTETVARDDTAFETARTKQAICHEVRDLVHAADGEAKEPIPFRKPSLLRPRRQHRFWPRRPTLGVGHLRRRTTSA
jgi:hypothetical protein